MGTLPEKDGQRQVGRGSDFARQLLPLPPAFPRADFLRGFPRDPLGVDEAAEASAESEPLDATVRARPGRLSALSVSRSKSILHGFFVWAHRALNRPKRRFPARAVGDRSTGHRFRLRSAAQRRRLSASAGRIGCRCAWRRRPRHQARKTPSWPRSLANFSRF